MCNASPWNYRSWVVITLPSLDMCSWLRLSISMSADVPVFRSQLTMKENRSYVALQNAEFVFLLDINLPAVVRVLKKKKTKQSITRNQSLNTCDRLFELLLSIKRKNVPWQTRPSSAVSSFPIRFELKTLWFAMYESFLKFLIFELIVILCTCKHRCARLLLVHQTLLWQNQHMHSQFEHPYST